jgi:hypothetical protein
MSDTYTCEYCGRPVKGEPVDKVLRGTKHIFCTEFCFRLHFYKVSDMTYTDLKNMYDERCISVSVPNYSQLTRKED